MQNQGKFNSSVTSTVIRVAREVQHRHHGVRQLTGDFICRCRKHRQSLGGWLGQQKACHSQLITSLANTNLPPGSVSHLIIQQNGWAIKTLNCHRGIHSPVCDHPAEFLSHSFRFTGFQVVLSLLSTKRVTSFYCANLVLLHYPYPAPNKSSQ